MNNKTPDQIRIPSVALRDFEAELAGLLHGMATLTIHIKDGRLSRYTTSRDRSFIPGKPMTGSRGIQPSVHEEGHHE